MPIFFSSSQKFTSEVERITHDMGKIKSHQGIQAMMFIAWVENHLIDVRNRGYRMFLADVLADGEG